ncbi:MAG: Trm112 family protein [Elusimicrobia bacterium]|nr:Trm112 family protein [Elusimicrobiota bacterium]
MISEQLLSILACPKCKGPVVYVRDEAGEAAPKEHLDCAECRLRYRIEADIPVMLVDEAASY